MRTTSLPLSPSRLFRIAAFAALHFAIASPALAQETGTRPDTTQPWQIVRQPQSSMVLIRIAKVAGFD